MKLKHGQHLEQQQLLRQYNPDLNFDAVDIGTNITVPRVEALDEDAPVAKTTTASAE